MTETSMLVTPELEALKDVWTDHKTSFPISESDIRRWAIAAYYPEPPPRLFWDAEYAASTRWGGIVAPEDFNPFAWPIPTGDETDAASSIVRVGSGAVMNGGQADVFGVRMRPGDLITSRRRLAKFEERQTKSALMLFSYYETEWRNQHDEVVKTRTGTVIQF
jgi:MaoC dehydratase-like protein